MMNLQLRTLRHPDWEKEFPHLFGANSEVTQWTPVMEVAEDEKSYWLTLDIPGLKKEDIEIEVKDNQLLITGERKSIHEKDKIVRSEVKYGKFLRAFQLPENLEIEKIEAQFDSGVLTVTLPKAQKVKPKKITIS